MQSAILKKMNYLEKKLDNLQNKKKEFTNNAKARQEKVTEKIIEYQSKLKYLQNEKEQQNKKLN